jgi:DNA polymerase I-like protein with 3'-5' exonuclease and polymerase domains
MFTNPDIYLGNNFLVVDLETTNVEKGTALNGENTLLLACWNLGVDHPKYSSGRSHAVWGDEYSQGLLGEHIRAAEFVVAQGAKFELGWFRRCGFDLRKVLTYDTLLAEKVIAGNRRIPLSLDATAMRRGLGHKETTVSSLIKAEVCPSNIPQGLLEAYCHQDVALTEKIFLAQRTELQELGLLPVALCRNLVTPVLADIEPHGMGLDKDRVNAMYVDYKARWDALNVEFNRLTGGINPKSPKQMRAFLYGPAIAPVTDNPADALFFTPGLGFAEVQDYKGKEIKTDTGEKATNKGILTELVAITPEQKEFKKVAVALAMLKTPMQNLTKMKAKADKEERMYGTFNQAVAVTHRLSASARLGGMQLQNPERAFKKCFRARPGYAIIQADAAQLEFRVAADLARDDLAYNLVKSGGDVHALAASTLGVSRDAAKAKSFRPLYGGSSGTPKEKAYYKAFREAYPDIFKEQTRWTLEVAKTKALRIASGLIFYWPDTEIKQSGYVTNTTSIFNAPIQSFSWDIISLVLRDVWERIEGIDANIINAQHDSIILEVALESVDDVKTILVDSFTTRIYTIMSSLFGYEIKVPLGCGIKSGEFWGEGKEIKVEANV